MSIQSGVLAQRYTENSPNLKGNKIRRATKKSNVTLSRENAMSQIYDLAKSKGISVDEAVTKILKNAQTTLRAYVQSKGETPFEDSTALATQATLLRAGDVATTAAILDTTDEDALQTIEASEQNSIDINSPEMNMVLPVPVAAAICCCLQHLSEESGQSMGAFIKTLQGASNLVKKSKASNMIGDYGDPSNGEDWLDWFPGSGDVNPTDNYSTDNSLTYSSVGSALATIPVSGPVTVSGNFPTVSTQGVNLPQAGNSTSSGGVFNAITSVLAGINQVAQSVTQAANSSAGAAGAVKNAVSNVGANSIATYIQQNKSTILMVFALIVIVIFLAIYAAKRK